MPIANDAAVSRDVFQGGGDLGALMRSHDWGASALGDPEGWPRSLQSIVRMMLTSRYQMWMGWGPDLTFFCNDAYRPTLGVKYPRAIGQSARAVWAEIWSDIGPLIDHVLHTGEATYSEGMLLLLERSGFPEETYHTFSYSPLFDDAGAIAGMFCVVVEETERVINERRLGTLRKVASAASATKTEDELFRAVTAELAENDADMPFTLTYLFDEGGATARLVAWSGVAPADPVAQPVLDLLNSEAAFWPIELILAGASSATVDRLDSRFSGLPTGAWDRPPEQALIVALAQQSQEKTAAGFLIVGLNPYRPLDANYPDFMQLLAGQIAAALATVRAYEAERKRAEALAEIDRAKTAFFSNVSHEFRTPLTLMLGPLEDVLAHSSDDADAIRAQVALAHRNGVRLLRLVNSLLDFSRIEAGRVRAHFVPTDLAAYSGEIASSFRSAIEKAGLSLVITSTPLPEPVYLDRDMWEKIVLNLLSNAFKFTFEGSITVEIGLSADGAAPELRVRDTGIGIASAELPRLFERFHRVEGARGRTFEGSGIGLALVQELVKLHGGAIEADSTPGHGTCFIVRLKFGTLHLPADSLGSDSAIARPANAPAFIEEALRWLPQPSDIAAGAGTGALAGAAPPVAGALPGAGKRVLLADDNADMRDYVLRLLAAQGYTVETAMDGLVALAAARERLPDLILSDVMMPGLDGFGLLRAIRGEPALAGVPVILLSARAGEEAKIEGLDAGADDYLIKPFAARELVARVSANIQMARMRQDAARELQRLNLELEDRVTREVAERLKAEDALRQAQKMEAVGQLTGGVAHDFNNLLTIIIGGLETVRRSGPTDNTRLARGVDMAMQGARRAASLTARLLAFSRRQPLEPKPLDLNIVVRDSSELLHRTLGETIELETVLASRLWPVELDQNQLESAILNLAVNARDAMPDGGKLTIETANTMLDETYAATDSEVIPGQYAVISISDSGFGMPKSVVERVFEPFFTTKEVGKGTGLGLSMVYGFAKQSGGHVTIYSEEGQGTTVRLYFPRYRGAAEEAEAVAPPTIVQGQKHEIILVVEDNDEVRDYSTMVLSELGYGVMEAENADAALKILGRPGRIDLLFTDVVLPGKTGRVLADEALALRPDLKVLFTTGYSRNAIVHHGRLDAGVQLITKPFTYEQLAIRVRDLLEAGSGA